MTHDAEGEDSEKRPKGAALGPEDIPGFYREADREMHPEKYADPRVVEWFNRLVRERLGRTR